MRRDVQAVILILVGGAVLRISIGDTFLNYVKEGMRPWLLLSGGTLVVLGVLALIDVIRRARRGETAEEPDPHDPVDDDGHSHVHGPRAAWLLLLLQRRPRAAPVLVHRLEEGGLERVVAVEELLVLQLAVAIKRPPVPCATS